MKTYRCPFVLIIFFGSMILTYAQGTHVHKVFVKAENITRVECSLLYVYDKPNQFVGVQLRSSYNGEQLAKPPSKVELSFQSMSKNPLYQNDKDRVLVAIADGEQWTVGTLNNVVLKGQTENGVDIFYGDDRTKGFRPVLPNAQVKGGGGVTDLILELMSVEMTTEQFLKIINARSVEFRLANISFGFTDGQMNIVREFVTYITPGKRKELTLANTPDTLNTPLDPTLKWLKDELSKHGTRSGGGYREHLELGFHGCNMNYRYVPQLSSGFDSNRTLGPPMDEYTFSLADIDVGSVSVQSSEARTVISFGTWDGQRKIKVVTKDSVTGVRSGSFQDRIETSASIELNATKSSLQIRDSLVHAIKLCQQ